MGRAVVSSGRDLSLVSGRDLIVSALADTATSKSSNWGVSLDLSPSGVTVGGNIFKSKFASVLYTNGQISAGGDVTAVSGRDMRFAGANIAGTNIYLDAGHDLVVASRKG